MTRLSLELNGMGCGGCIKNVRNTLEALPGVTIETVAVGSAMLAYDPAQSSREIITEALGRAGYPARAAGTATASTGSAHEGGHCGV